MPTDVDFAALRLLEVALVFFVEPHLSVLRQCDLLCGSGWRNSFREDTPTPVSFLNISCRLVFIVCDDDAPDDISNPTMMRGASSLVAGCCLAVFGGF